jgi:hypothetical protein
MNTEPKRLLVCLLVAVSAAGAHAITFGQIDTFEDGTTNLWTGGSLPSNQLGGPGPVGVDDHFLQCMAGPTAGLHLACYNQAQWAGDYTAVGVTVLNAFMRNQGPDVLEMRAVVMSPSGSRATSTTSISLPADGVWRCVNFPINAASLTVVQGGQTAPAILAGVERLMFRHDPGGPSSGGTEVSATLGTDFIIANNEYMAVPTSITVLRGLATTALDMNRVWFSEDVRIQARPGVVLTSALAPVLMEFSSAPPLLTATQYTVAVESSGTAPLQQIVSFFSYSSNQFVAVDTRTITSSEANAVIAVSNSPAYASPLGPMRVQVSFKATGPVLIYPWQARVDRIRWSLAP